MHPGWVLQELKSWMRLVLGSKVSVNLLHILCTTRQTLLPTLRWYCGAGMWIHFLQEHTKSTICLFKPVYENWFKFNARPKAVVLDLKGQHYNRINTEAILSISGLGKGEYFDFWTLSDFLDLHLRNPERPFRTKTQTLKFSSITMR